MSPAEVFQPKFHSKLMFQKLQNDVKMLVMNNKSTPLKLIPSNLTHYCR
jgi:hypothetical protein